MILNLKSFVLAKVSYHQSYKILPIYSGIFQKTDVSTVQLLYDIFSSTALSSPRSTIVKNLAVGHSMPFIRTVDKESVGNCLVATRHMSTISSIDGQTGEILWTLGGYFYEFTDLFNTGTTQFSPASDREGLVILLDISAHEAILLTSYSDAKKVLAASQGNMRIVAFIEFAARGKILCDAHFGASTCFSFGRIVSYRTFN
ncbi:hypothetical protein N7520_000512 [Penicillium odoratum]|uniref:uncharacterized protein n=1 Tax=Penicillium odoratum TaxID=1167516 RepID=UPI002546F719|nr:uncharacterized protein N7520_000512 [Penicillium odoratum]KAJ5777266.1 hypothetical protein N7520_000512 [Penicillium odoratum]